MGSRQDADNRRETDFRNAMPRLDLDRLFRLLGTIEPALDRDDYKRVLDLIHVLDADVRSWLQAVKKLDLHYRTHVSPEDTLTRVVRMLLSLRQMLHNTSGLYRRAEEEWALAASKVEMSLLVDRIEAQLRQAAENPMGRPR